jgi:hypothetical protein
MSKDGVHWTPRYAVAHPGTTVLWPWIAAGTPGNVSVVWYQYDRPTPNPDQATKGNVSVMDANVFGLGTRHVTKAVANAAGRPVHVGGICQGGTACVATGQDRRLGDYFTNWLDGRGCVIIATGDTMTPDAVTGQERAWATPIFLRQDGGKSLTGKTCGPAHVAAGIGSGRAAPALLGALMIAAAGAMARRSRSIAVPA